MRMVIAELSNSNIDPKPRMQDRPTKISSWLELEAAIKTICDRFVSLTIVPEVNRYRRCFLSGSLFSASGPDLSTR